MSKIKTMEYKFFPDSGPEQHQVQRWIEKNGGEAHLYDGVLETDVETSTGANWRWNHMSIENCNRWPEVGDYIVKITTGYFVVMNEEDFREYEQD